MAQDSASHASPFASALRTFRRPWPIMLAGFACMVIGLGFTQSSYVPPQVIFMLVGTLLTGIAVARRLQTTSWELEDRMESAGLLAAAAFAALLGLLGMGEKWDSGRYFYTALLIITLTTSFLVLLPRTGRRFAAVLLLALHFGGILTAVTAVPPRNEPAPWLSMQIWTYFYRHYLTFAYLTNAYHFYSPDPGPPTLVWFHVEYEDGQARWVKIPNRSESPVGLHHQRMLAAAESAYNPILGAPLTRDMIPIWEEKFHRDYEVLPGIHHDGWEDIVTRRKFGETMPFTDPKDNDRPAPLRIVEDEPAFALTQYSEPQEMARRLIASFARHIGRTSPDLENPSNSVKAVRVYRVTHELISPRELNEGKEPLDETTFKAFYMGKYDLDGRLIDGGKWDREQKKWIEPPDPFLFWMMPILKVPRRYPEPGTHLFAHTPQEGEEKLLDFVEIHAAQSDKLAKLNTGK